MEGDVNIDLATLRFGPAEVKPLVGAVYSLQPCPGIGNPYPASSRVAGVPGSQSSAVVPDDYMQLLILLFCLDPDDPRTSPRFYPVADGVLHQWLKNEGRNQGFHEFIRNALFHSKSFAKTLSLDAEICPNELELLPQRNLLFLHRIK